MQGRKRGEERNREERDRKKYREERERKKRKKYREIYRLLGTEREKKMPD